jgi:hypothetical protein
MVWSGLQVRQQLDSFDQFITNELQEIVSGTPTMSISAQKSYAPGVKTHEVCIFNCLETIYEGYTSRKPSA